MLIVRIPYGERWFQLGIGGIRTALCRLWVIEETSSCSQVLWTQRSEMSGVQGKRSNSSSGHLLVMGMTWTFGTMIGLERVSCDFVSHVSSLQLRRNLGRSRNLRDGMREVEIRDRVTQTGFWTGRWMSGRNLWGSWRGNFWFWRPRIGLFGLLHRPESSHVDRLGGIFLVVVRFRRDGRGCRGCRFH